MFATHELHDGKACVTDVAGIYGAAKDIYGQLTGGSTDWGKIANDVSTGYQDFEAAETDCKLSFKKETILGD